MVLEAFVRGNIVFPTSPLSQEDSEKLALRAVVGVFLHLSLRGDSKFMTPGADPTYHLKHTSQDWRLILRLQVLERGTSMMGPILHPQM